MIEISGLSFSLDPYWVKMNLEGECYGCKRPIDGRGWALFVQVTPPKVEDLLIKDAQTTVCLECYDRVKKTLPGMEAN